ncbi:MAG: alpha/beta hydrolase, partial [Bdellovibrionota bacterium]
YEVFGQGKPIVLVHGWSSSILYNWNYTGWITALKPYRKVIALDIRGHGDSGKPHIQSAYSYSKMARDVLAVMNKLGIQKADLLGYSLGAQSGAFLLGRHTSRFTSVALIGIGDETPESIALAPKIAQALRAVFPWQIPPEAEIYRFAADLDPRNDLEALALAALQMWPEGFPVQLGGPGLADVEIPVLLLNGADDPYADTVGNLAAALPGAEVVEIPGADHFGMADDVRFKDAVIDFLTSQ